MFTNIKDRLDNPSVRKIMSACVYRNSVEVAINKLSEYNLRPAWSMYGWIEDGEIVGICGFEVHQMNRIDILHIAVAERGQGVGSKMLDALRELFCLTLKAETDDDAVGFYRKYGFVTTAFRIKGVTRHICVFDLEENNGDIYG